MLNNECGKFDAEIIPQNYHLTSQHNQIEIRLGLL